MCPTKSPVFKSRQLPTAHRAVATTQSFEWMTVWSSFMILSSTESSEEPKSMTEPRTGNTFQKLFKKKLLGPVISLAVEKQASFVAYHGINPAMPATDLCHPQEDRPLSIEEYKRIQQFPDDWKMAGTLTDQYRQIGNAIPVGLGEAIGRLVISLLEKNNKPKNGN